MTYTGLVEPCVSSKKNVSFPKDSNYSTSSNNFNDNGNNDICRYGGAYYIHQAPYQALIFHLFEQQLFLESLLCARFCCGHLHPRDGMCVWGG